MEIACPSTALSPAVKHLICSVGCSGDKGGDVDVKTKEQHRQNLENETSGPPFVSSSGDIDLDRIVSLFPDADDSAHFFESAVAVLAPVFAECRRVMSEMSDACTQSALMPHLLWTRSEKILRDCLKLLQEEAEDGAQDILVLLLVSAVLERALGNVYLVRGRQCPSMLKDLLVTEQLVYYLGRATIQILRVVIGPPTSLNLRNVAWHGFLGDSELPRRYCCFLLLLTANIGKILEDQHLLDIPQRSFFVWTPDVTSKLWSALQLPGCRQTGVDVQSVKKLLTTSLLVQSQTQQQWSLAFRLFEQGCYGYCLSLLLPLLEHCLRRVFAAVNGCPERVLTAESSAFYTTFNEMLEQTLPDGETNQLPVFLTTPCMDLLQDLLFYPEGPRVRDHLSHGEVEFGGVDATMVVVVLHVVVFLAHRLSSSAPHDDAFTVMVDRVRCYKSVFHPIALLQCKFSHHLKLLKRTDSLVQPSACHELFGDDHDLWQREASNPLLSRTRDMMMSLWQCDAWAQVSSLSLEDLKNGSGLDLLVLEEISQQHIPTLFRWQQLETDPGQAGYMRESEFVGLLRRITEEIGTAEEQVQKALEMRQHQLQIKQLRSRQRENLKKLVLCVPCLQLLSAAMSAVIAWCLQLLHQFTSFTPTQCKHLQKFLKWSLQQSENVRTLTSLEKNKWTESVELLLQWLPRCQQFVTQWCRLSS